MGSSRGVLVRDFLIFQLKLALDGLKDLVLFQVAIAAAVVDFLRGPKASKLFYRVMSLGERVDLWLNLYGATSRADAGEDGLFGASKAGSDSLLGQLEQALRGGDEPRRR